MNEFLTVNRMWKCCVKLPKKKLRAINQRMWLQIAKN